MDKLSRYVIDSERTLRRILAMEDEGATRKAIANRLGVDYSGLCQELKAAGHPGRSGGVPRTVSDEQLAEGRRLIVEERLTYVQAAVRLGVPRSALQHLLTQQGVRVGRRAKLADADVAEADELHRKGWTMASIARKFGVTQQTISIRLRYFRGRPAESVNR